MKKLPDDEIELRELARKLREGRGTLPIFSLKELPATADNMLK